MSLNTKMMSANVLKKVCDSYMFWHSYRVVRTLHYKGIALHAKGMLLQEYKYFIKKCGTLKHITCILHITVNILYILYI